MRCGSKRTAVGGGGGGGSREEGHLLRYGRKKANGRSGHGIFSYKTKPKQLKPLTTMLKTDGRLKLFYVLSIFQSD